MNKCPICTETFSPLRLDKHIDKCLGISRESPEKAKSFEIQKHDKSTNPSANRSEKNENNDSENLANEIILLKNSMKRITDIVKNKPRPFHEKSEPLYENLDNCLRKFMKNFDGFCKVSKILKYRESIKNDSPLDRNFKNIYKEPSTLEKNKGKDFYIEIQNPLKTVQKPFRMNITKIMDEVNLLKSPRMPKIISLCDDPKINDHECPKIYVKNPEIAREKPKTKKTEQHTFKMDSKKDKIAIDRNVRKHRGSFYNIASPLDLTELNKLYGKQQKKAETGGPKNESPFKTDREFDEFLNSNGKNNPVGFKKNSRFENKFAFLSQKTEPSAKKGKIGRIPSGRKQPNGDARGKKDRGNSTQLEIQRRENYKHVEWRIESLKMEVDIGSWDAKTGKIPKEKTLLDFENNKKLAVFSSEIPKNVCCVCKQDFEAEFILQSEICSHKTCQFCLCAEVIKRIEQKDFERNKLLCMETKCGEEIPSRILTAALPKQHFELFCDQQIQYIKASDNTLVSCPACDFSFYRARNDSQKSSPDEMSIDRFSCRNCRKEFCAVCLASPFHSKKTCAEFSAYKLSRKCRFCQKAIEKNSEMDVCGEIDCRRRSGMACWKKRPCGHFCPGCRDHESCMECFKVDCQKKRGEPDPKIKEGDFCQICWVEGLEAAPCVQLGCGHLFHASCIKTKFEKKWPTARISFNYLSCPLCKAMIESINSKSLMSLLLDQLNFYHKIRKIAFNRIEVEGFKNDKELVDPKGRFYNQPHDFALQKFAFYTCCRCKNPYFGGIRNCEEAIGDLAEKFDKSQLVCGPCSDGSNQKKCLLHGNEFLTYKCKFCCSVANWFCWGNTHFCDTCHKKQVGGNYISRKKLSNLKQCRGKNTCPLKVNHPPNGQEFCLGCVVCLRK